MDGVIKLSLRATDPQAKASEFFTGGVEFECPKADLSMPMETFCKLYLYPAFAQLKNMVSE